jgi:hypothetical protein
MAGDKYYKQERARQARFKKSEEDMNKRYKQILDQESEFEYLNSIRPEDSTEEYNPVEYYEKFLKLKKLRCINMGDISLRGKGRAFKDCAGEIRM